MGWAWQWGRREHRPLARTPASTPQLAAVEPAAEMVAHVAVVAGCSTKLEE